MNRDLNPYFFERNITALQFEQICSLSAIGLSHIVHLFWDLPISHSIQTSIPSGISLPQAIQVLMLIETTFALFSVCCSVFLVSSCFFNSYPLCKSRRFHRIVEIRHHHAVQDVEHVRSVYFVVLKLAVIHADGKIKHCGENTM